MNWLLDTHALVAVLQGQRRYLGREAERVLRHAAAGAGDACVSVVSLWEISLLMDRGRLRSSTSWSDWVGAARRAPGLRIEPLLLDDVEQARAFPGLVDPADRLIVGTALRLGATLITRDERIVRSKVVPVLW